MSKEKQKQIERTLYALETAIKEMGALKIMMYPAYKVEWVEYEQKALQKIHGILDIELEFERMKAAMHEEK